MEPSVLTFVKSVAEVVVAVATVIGIFWKVFDGMITKKVRSQIEEAMHLVTQTTSGEISKLREELRETHVAQDEKLDRKFEALTNRIDRLFKRGGE